MKVENAGVAPMLPLFLGILISWSGFSPAANPQNTVVLTAETAADFQTRLDTYVQMRRRFDATLPGLPSRATPVQIDQHQRSLERLLVQARVTAKQGDLFTPTMQTFLRQLAARVFAGPAGARVRKEIADEPHPVIPAINKRYPDDVPVSTMPPGLLASLPKLPEGLEYRFVNFDLILMDVPAHLIVDYVLDVIPKAVAAPGGP